MPGSACFIRKPYEVVYEGRESSGIVTWEPTREAKKPATGKVRPVTFTVC